MGQRSEFRATGWCDDIVFGATSRRYIESRTHQTPQLTRAARHMSVAIESLVRYLQSMSIINSRSTVFQMFLRSCAEARRES
jgi:hypothetical protein